jgi:hypothetical protein
MELNYLKLNHTLIFIFIFILFLTITKSLRNPKNQCEDWTKPKVPFKIKTKGSFKTNQTTFLSIENKPSLGLHDLHEIGPMFPNQSHLRSSPNEKNM